MLNSTTKIAIQLALILSFDAAAVAVVCPTVPVINDLAGQPSVAVNHIFCGNENDEVATGYHYNRGGATPDTYISHQTQQQANNQGVYQWGGIEMQFSPGILVYKNASTFFPDACSIAQILMSIRYANNNLLNPRPLNCPMGADCGNSGPNVIPNPNPYCYGLDNLPFQINLVFDAHNNLITTAYPVKS